MIAASVPDERAGNLLGALDRGRVDDVTGTAVQDERARQVRDWLLAILRFAVTREQPDKATVLALAAEMDGSGSRLNASPFAFFARTSAEFCDAIIREHDAERATALRRHLMRIDDQRLRGALEAAIETPAGALPKARKRDLGNLWSGLPQKE